MVVDVFSYIVFRSHAIACVNQFIVTRTQALMVHIGTFIEVETFVLFFCEFKTTSNLHLATALRPLTYRKQFIWLQNYGVDIVQVDESFFL